MTKSIFFFASKFLPSYVGAVWNAAYGMLGSKIEFRLTHDFKEHVRKIYIKCSEIRDKYTELHTRHKAC